MGGYHDNLSCKVDGKYIENVHSSNSAWQLDMDHLASHHPLDLLAWYLTSIAGLVHVNDLDLTTQIFIFSCQTC